MSTRCARCIRPFRRPRSAVQPAVGNVAASSKDRFAGFNASAVSGVRDDCDVLPKRRRQPGAFAGLGIDEHHHPEGAIAVERVLGVRPHNDATRLTPFTVGAADGDASVEGEDDLNRVVRMRGHDALSSGREEEPSLPQVPARNGQPAIGVLVRCVRQARILPAAVASAFRER